MKILIIQQKMIGDVLTSSILFEVLRLKYPKAQLDYLINEHTFPVVENNPFIDNFIFFTKEIESSKKALYRLAKTVKYKKYDIVIDVYSKFSSNFITLFSGAKTKISKEKWYTSFIYTHTFKEAKVSKTEAGLAIENRLQFLTPIIKNKPLILKPKIYLTSKEIVASKEFLNHYKLDLSKPIFMLSALGSSKNKTYPLPYMANIIDAIVNYTNGYVLFNYIPSQLLEIEELFSLCKKSTQRKIYLEVYGKNLREFLAITKHCSAVIGNEGGAINMAKALNIPTFSIFSPWILKEAWNMFEDSGLHTSIHLKDVKPQLYKGKELKSIKKNTQDYYDIFSPKYMLPNLKSFLKKLV